MSGFSFAAPAKASGGGGGGGFKFSVPKPGAAATAPRLSAFGSVNEQAPSTALGSLADGGSFSVPKPQASMAKPSAFDSAAAAAAAGSGSSGGSFSLRKPGSMAIAPAPAQAQSPQRMAVDAPAARFPAIAWGPCDELQMVSSAGPDIVYEDEEDDEEVAPPPAPTSATVAMDEPHMSAPYFQRLAQISYQVYADLLLQPRPGKAEAQQALRSYEECLLQCIGVAAERADDSDHAEEACDDLLRLSMSAGILRLCRTFFFDEMASDLSGALREWFAAFSAGASESGGHVNILNPESCLEDEQLWQFLHKHTEFPQDWRLDPEWSRGPDSLGWRMVYAFVTTGALDHAWSLMLQIDLQSSISAQTKEIMNGWVGLLRGGTSANDFVYRRQVLVDKAGQLVRSSNAQEAALLRILSGDPAALGLHEPVNWVEHLIGTLLYGRRESDDNFISPVYEKEFVGETLLESSMDAVEQRADDTGREVCTFMNPALFKQVGVQHARGVLQQIADPEVALGFVWLELHLGHVLHLTGRLIDDLPIPAGPLAGASYLESLTLEYAEQCRAVPQLQRIALRMYLSCPVYGLDYVRETLGRMTHAPMTEMEARKLLSIASAIQGQGDAAMTICRIMASNAASQGRYSTATYWLLQSGDSERADALAERMLRELTEDLAEQNGCLAIDEYHRDDNSSEPQSVAQAQDARRQRQQELRNTAMIAQQSQAGASAGVPTATGSSSNNLRLPPALAFLCGLSELSVQVEALLDMKAAAERGTSAAAEMQPLPELQEKIEVGVGTTVAQMIQLFNGTANAEGRSGRWREHLHLMQYWLLLFDNAMTISTIITPSLDRDETIALMGFVERYANSKRVVGQPSKHAIGAGYGNARVNASAEERVLNRVRGMLAENLAGCFLTFRSNDS